MQQNNINKHFGYLKSLSNFEKTCPFSQQISFSSAFASIRSRALLGVSGPER